MDQGELFPFLAPETVLAYVRQTERRVLAIGPELSRGQCQLLLGELSILHTVLDRMEREITHRADYRRRQQVRPELTVREITQLNTWPEIALRRARAKKAPPAWSTRRREPRGAALDQPGAPGEPP